MGGKVLGDVCSWALVSIFSFLRNTEFMSVHGHQLKRYREMREKIELIKASSIENMFVMCQCFGRVSNVDINSPRSHLKMEALKWLQS